MKPERNEHAKFVCYGYKLYSKGCLKGAPLFMVHSFSQALKMKQLYTNGHHIPVWIVPIKKSEYMKGIWRDPLLSDF